MDKISFQGKSQLFFDPNMYKKLQNKTSTTYRHVSDEIPREIQNFTTFSTTTPNSDVVLYMGNEKSGIIRNIPLFDTNLDPLENITLRNLTHQADELIKTAKDKLTVWIIGGDKIKGENGKKTVKTVNDIAETLCDREDVDGNILSGAKDKVYNVVFRQAGGKLDVVIGNNIKPANIETEELAKHFDIVELSNVIAG